MHWYYVSTPKPTIIKKDTTQLVKSNPPKWIKSYFTKILTCKHITKDEERKSS